MLFNSLEFVCFFLIVFFLYWFVFSKKNQLQNLLILFSSYLFYAWWDWRFLILIIISSLTDYLSGLNIQNSKTKTQKKIVLGISLFVNLGILFFFKYFNFFIDNFFILQESSNISSNNVFIPSVPLSTMILS